MYYNKEDLELLPTASEIDMRGWREVGGAERKNSARWPETGPLPIKMVRENGQMTSLGAHLLFNCNLFVA